MTRTCLTDTMHALTQVRRRASHVTVVRSDAPRRAWMNFGRAAARPLARSRHVSRPGDVHVNDGDACCNAVTIQADSDACLSWPGTHMRPIGKGIPTRPTMRSVVATRTPRSVKRLCDRSLGGVTFFNRLASNAVDVLHEPLQALARLPKLYE